MAREGDLQGLVLAERRVSDRALPDCALSNPLPLLSPPGEAPRSSPPNITPCCWQFPSLPQSKYEELHVSNRDKQGLLVYCEEAGSHRVPRCRDYLPNMEVYLTRARSSSSPAMLLAIPQTGGGTLPYFSTLHGFALSVCVPCRALGLMSLLPCKWHSTGIR